MLSPGIVIASLLAVSAPYPYEEWECDFPVSVHCSKASGCRSAAGPVRIVLSLGDSLYERCEGRFCEPYSVVDYEEIGDVFVASAAENSLVLVVADGLAATETKATQEGVWISTGKCRALDHDPMFHYNIPPPSEAPPGGPGERGRPIS